MQHYAAELLQNPNPIVRWRTALALGMQRTGDDKTIAALSVALNDSEWRVRGNAVKSLGKLKPQDPGVFAHVLTVMLDGDECVRHEASSALNYMLDHGFRCSEEDVARIASHCTDPRSDVRVDAVNALGRVHAATPEAVAAVVKTLADPDDQVRFWAVLAVGEMTGLAARAVPSLIECLATGGDELKSAAVLVLSEMGSEACSAVPALRQLLGTNNPHLRLETAHAITMVDKDSSDQAVIQALQEALALDNPDERRVAADALSRLGIANEFG